MLTAVGPVAGVLTYRMATVVDPVLGTPGGLGLVVAPPAGAVDTLVVHASPDVRAAGPLDQTQPPVVAPPLPLVVDPLVVGPSEATTLVREHLGAAGATIERAELVGLVPEAVLRATPAEEWDALDLSADRTIEARLARRRVG